MIPIWIIGFIAFWWGIVKTWLDDNLQGEHIWVTFEQWKHIEDNHAFITAWWPSMIESRKHFRP